MQPPRATLLLACTVGLPIAGSAQDVIYSNIFTSRGTYSDAIIFAGSSGERVLAVERTIDRRTDSTRGIVVRKIGSAQVAYWMDARNPTDGVFAGRDLNINGAIDATEMITAYSFDSTSEGGIAELGGTFWVANGSSSGTTAGIWMMRDGNSDLDFMDTGEATRLVAAPTQSIGGSVCSTDDPRAIAILPNGDAIWHEDDNKAWFRTTPAGVSSIYFAYRGTSIPVPPLKLNPDIGSALPVIGGTLDKVAVDPAGGTVYFGVRTSAAQPYILAGNDANKDGDLQDAGEVNLAFDGTKATPRIDTFEGLTWFNGALYVIHERSTPTFVTQVLRMQDANKNGTFEPAEITVFRSLSANQNPEVGAFTMVPPGTFLQSCATVAAEADAPLSTRGGTVKFTLRNVPANLLGKRGFVALSVTGDAPFMLFGGCVVGLSVDPATVLVWPFLQGDVNAGTVAMPQLNYPSGAPTSLRVYFAGLVADLTTGRFLSISPTGVLPVR